MKEVIKTVIEKLQHDIPQLRYIAEDWGQLEFGERPVQFPCALIDLDGFEFRQMGQQTQTAEGDIYIRIADEAVAISAKAPDRMHDRAYEYYDLLQNVHNAIHGLTDNQTFQKLIQTSLKRGSIPKTVETTIVSSATEEYLSKMFKNIKKNCNGVATPLQRRCNTT